MQIDQAYIKVFIQQTQFVKHYFEMERDAWTAIDLCYFCHLTSQNNTILNSLQVWDLQTHFDTSD